MPPPLPSLLAALSPSPGAFASARPAFSLHQHVVAIESLASLAEQLRDARAALTASLPPAMGREVEAYFSRTVDATVDLRATVFRGAARAMLQARPDCIPHSYSGARKRVLWSGDGPRVGAGRRPVTVTAAMDHRRPGCPSMRFASRRASWTRSVA